jgi:kynurenine formamidase
VELRGVPYDSSPLHRYALRDLGVYLLESLDLEELARDKVYEFLFIGAPLRLTHASGSPWNPLAVI